MSPAIQAGTQFVHRSNRNGTTDTICRQCLTTVATATWEAELDRAERVHACEPGMMRVFRKTARQERVARLAHSRAIS